MGGAFKPIDNHNLTLVRSYPVLKLRRTYSALAQSVERVTVNH